MMTITYTVIKKLKLVYLMFLLFLITKMRLTLVIVVSQTYYSLSTQNLVNSITKFFFNSCCIITILLI